MTQIFVFGSNLAGKHAGGSARAAVAEHGALWGCGIGPQGNSYAIPTLDEFFERISLDRIELHVKNFLDYAADNPEMKFNVVAIGCGIAGFSPAQIAPMFKGCGDNVNLPAEFREVLS
jgi:hypothetical protein